MSSLSFDWNKVNQPELVFQRFASRRSQVYGTKGVVACSQPLAAEAGLEILRKGGNAGTISIIRSMSPTSIIPFNPGLQPMQP